MKQKEAKMQVKTNQLKPNPSQIYLIARALDISIKDFYDDPANEKAFEEWKSKKEVKDNAEVKSSTNRQG